MNDTTKAPGRMQVAEYDEAGHRRRRRWQTVLLASVSVLVLAGGAVFAWYLTPPAMPTTAEEAIAVAKSPRFARLSADEKRPYFDVFREQFGLNPELRQIWREDPELRDASREMWREMMNQRMNAFMLADFDEQQEMIAESPFGRPRGGGEGGRSEGNRDRGDGQGRPDAAAMRDRMSERISNGNPQTSAAMGEMIRARRAQREANQH
ncbi:MAG: hypothetical protein AAGJ38_03885 [Planctomycetota bacterium]